MPLTNDVIMRLNEITVLVEDKSEITDSEISQIKSVFYDILKNGQDYDVDEVGSWLENEGTWNNKDARTRVTNLSHYVQSKYEQTARLRMVSDSDSCGCD